MCVLAFGVFTLRTWKRKANSCRLRCAWSSGLKWRQNWFLTKTSILRVWIHQPTYFRVTDVGTSQLGEGVSVLQKHCWHWEMIALFLRPKVTSQTSPPSFEILISNKSPWCFVAWWTGLPVCSVQTYSGQDSLLESLLPTVPQWLS